MTDSAGVPWHGRDLQPNPFSGDAGEADPALLAALRDVAAGRRSAREVVEALSGTRLLVPVVAETGSEHPAPDLARGDLGADMSIPLLAMPGPDGRLAPMGPSGPTRTALPAFTSQTALMTWQPAARPVPVEAERAALSAVDEGCVGMVIDPGSEHAFVVNRPALWALAQGRPWVPALQDPAVQIAVQGALSYLEHVVAVRLEPGTSAEVAVVVGLSDIDPDQLGPVLTEVARRLGDEPIVAERIDSVQLRPVRAQPTSG